MAAFRLNRRVAAVLLLVVTAVALFIYSAADDHPSRPDGLGGVESTGLQGGASLPVAARTQQEPSGGDEASVERCAEQLDRLKGLSNPDTWAVISAAADTLADSPDPGHVLASAMLRRWDEPTKAIDTLQGLGGFGSDEPVTVWTMLAFCDQRPVDGCDFRMFESVAVRNYSQNGAIWVALALTMLESGRETEALRALQRAASTVEYDTYYFEQVTTIERGLAAATDWSYPERVFTAFGFALVSPLGFEALTRRCAAAADGVWMEACRELGRHMTGRAPDMLSQLIGLDLQRIAHKNAGDEDALLAIEQQRDKIKSLTGSMENVDQSMLLMVLDEKVLRDHLDNIGTYGEAESHRRLRSEIERLKNDPGYDQCNLRLPLR